MNSTYAVRWLAPKGLWIRAHTNRVDLSPGRIGPIAVYAQPLSRMEGHGGGQAWNFYQENWESQGPHCQPHPLLSTLLRLADVLRPQTGTC